jgi:hypothetical protein
MQNKGGRLKGLHNFEFSALLFELLFWACLVDYL